MTVQTLRLTPHRIQPLLVAASLLLPLGLVAPGAEAAPATDAEMSLYTRIAAVNVCIALGADVPFDKAAPIAGETIAQLIQGQHGGQIRQVGDQPLSIEELRRGSVNSAVLGAVELCPKLVPADVTQSVEEALKQEESGPAAPPARTP